MFVTDNLTQHIVKFKFLGSGCLMFMIYAKLYVCLTSFSEEKTTLVDKESGNDDGEGFSDDDVDENEHGDEAMEDDYDDVTEEEPTENNGDDSFLLDDATADEFLDSDDESNCSINM